jgi:Contractile injection system tube protein/LysM domain
VPLTEKAFLEIEGSTDTVPCMFNPAELSVARSNAWAGVSIAGQGVPQVKYLGAGSGLMSLRLIFDTTDTGQAVTRHTGKMLKLMDVDPALPGTDPQTNNARPPYVIFHWGNLHSFKAVVSNLSLQFTYFSSTGIPLRASVELSLTQFAESSAFGPQNPTSGTPEPHRVHRVQPGETLDRISARYYADSTRWRQIATANGIVDPLALRTGSLLRIPRAGQ